LLALPEGHPNANGAAAKDAGDDEP
jgi:hypothetical protein